MPIAAGARFGVYEIVEAIGAGGMGEVYRATDVELKRDVAIKVLPEAFAGDADRLARFRREAETLAALNHPNIAQIYGLEKSDAGTLIVMELIPGPTLADRIAQGPLPPDEALGIARQIAAALEAAHERQIVHRDLKPANIKLRADGTVKVLDFGIAKTVDARTTSGGRTPTVMTPAVTETGVILGTAAYMAPEQARGRPVDQRADIWAFGCLLFEMLTGEPAFIGEDVMLTLARVLDRETDLRSVPGTVSPAVRRAIQLCLEKNPKRRIADIRDVCLAMEGAFAGDGPAAGAGASASTRRWLPHAVAALAGGAAALLAAVLLQPEAEAPDILRYRLPPPPNSSLASLNGIDLEISRDGRHVAYLGVSGNRQLVDLFVHDLDSLEPRRLVVGAGSAASQSVNPFFSADGRWIGYWSEGQGLMRVPVDGGPPLRIAEIPGSFRGADVMRDGTVIFAAAPSGLYRVASAGGGKPEHIATPIDDTAITYGPQLLPGETRVLLSFQSDSGDAEIGVLDLASGDFEVVIRDGRNGEYARSGQLTFVRGTTLMAVPFDPEGRFDLEGLVVGEAAALFDGIRAPVGMAADYALAADGTLSYVEDDGAAGAAASLVWLSRDGNVAESMPLGATSQYFSPQLSPDGGRVALLHATGPADIDLWVHDLRGRPALPITEGGVNAMSAWSPDSASLAFVSVEGGNDFAVVVAPADGSMLEPAPLRADLGATGPTVWTGDGDIIAIADRSDDASQSFDIVAFRADGSGDVRNVVATTDNEFDPALSPNGRWLAYAWERAGGTEIWVKAYPDGAPVRVSDGGGIEPQWSHDGTELYYLRGATVMAVTVDTDGATFEFNAGVALFDLSYVAQETEFFSSYDVAGGGRFLAIEVGSVADAPASAIVVVRNFFEELRRLAPRP